MRAFALPGVFVPQMVAEARGLAARKARQLAGFAIL